MYYTLDVSELLQMGPHNAISNNSPEADECGNPTHLEEEKAGHYVDQDTFLASEEVSLTDQGERTFYAYMVSCTLLRGWNTRG